MAERSSQSQPAVSVLYVAPMLVECFCQGRLPLRHTYDRRRRLAPPVGRISDYRVCFFALFVVLDQYAA
jgi:hypothetical protein